MQINNLLKTNNSLKITFLFIWCFYTSLYGATWYSDAIGGNPNDLTKWWSKSNGTGNHPSGFLDANDIFYLKYGHAYVTINTWNIGGTLQVYGELTIQSSNFIKGLVIYNKGIVFGNAQTSILDASVGGLLSINDGGKYVFNHAIPNNYKTLFAGQEMFGSTSVLEFQDFERTNGAFSICLANSSSKIGTVNWNIQEGNTAYNLNCNSRTNRSIAGDFNVVKTGALGSLSWCNNKEAAKFTIEGNYIQSGGRFYMQRSSIGSDSCILVIQKDFNLNAGVFDIGSSENFSASLELHGNFTMNNGKFYRSSLHPKKNVTVDFKGVKDQIYNYIAGEFDSKNIAINIVDGANVVLNSNLNIEYSLGVYAGGTLNIPNPFEVVGNGTCEILRRGKLIIGNVEGINLVVSKGAIQTSNRLFHSEITLEYNGVSFQKTGDACKYVFNLILNNSLGLEFTQDITIQNDGILTLRKGFHDLNGKILTLGTSSADNNLIYEEGGLYSKNNLGVFRRWLPTIILTENTRNNYGFFPFAKSVGQIGFVKFFSTDSIKGGILSISPIFEKDTEINCNVKDSSKTIYKIQKAFSYKIIENTLTSGNSITMEYTCGNLKYSKLDISNYCLAACTPSGLLSVGQYNGTLGDQQLPKVRRSFSSWKEIIPNCSFLLGSYDSLVSLKIQCNLSGVKSVGPTGDYVRLTDALTAISDNGFNSAIILELQSTYISTTEVYPLKINSFSCLGASNTLLIRPAENAKNLVIGKSIDNTIIHFNQSDFVTIDGRPASSAENSQLTIQNSNPLGTTFLLSSGATYNSLKYLTIEGAQSNISRGVVEFTSFLSTSNCYDSISNCTIQNYSGKSIANAIYSKGDGLLKKNEINYISKNKFVNCVSAGIFLDVYNQTWVIKDNHFYQTTSFKPTSTVYGIHIVNEGSGYFIDGNYIGGQSPNCNGSPYSLNTSQNHFFPIYLSVTGVYKPNIIQYNIISNIILNNTDGSSLNPGVFTGIYVSGIPMSNSTIILGNRIGDTTKMSSNAIKILSSVSGALIQAVFVNTNGAILINKNLIGNISTINSANKGSVFYGIRTIGNGDCLIKNNKIGSWSYSSTIQIGGTETGNASCIFYGINNSNLGKQIINNNEIINCSVYGLGASQIYGIYNVSNTSDLSITWNKITLLGNMAQYGENLEALSLGIYQDAGSNNSIENNSILAFQVNNGFFKGIYLNNTTGNSFVSSNIIGRQNMKPIQISSISKCSSFNSNVINNHGGIIISASCTNCHLVNNKISAIKCGEGIDYIVGGIVIGAGTKSTFNLATNLIEKIGCSNVGLFSTEIFGIYFGNNSLSTSIIKKNKIRNLYNLNSNKSAIYGLYVFASNQRIINNFISISNSDGDSTFSNAVTLSGLQFANSINTNTISVFYNTIDVGGSLIQGSQNSYALNQIESTSNVNFLFVNNIFQNARKGGNGAHYAYFTNTNSLTNKIFINNYFVAPSSVRFAFLNSDITLNYLLSIMNSYGNEQSKLSLIPFLFNSDGSSMDVSKFIPAADLKHEVDCSEDINGIVGGRGGELLDNHMGCFEGPTNVFYSISEVENLAADDLKNWNTKKDASGVFPLDFKQEESVYIIQTGHRSMLLSSWTGSEHSSVIIDTGGVLDLNAQTMTDWKNIQIKGDGIANSGVILNTSINPTNCLIPIIVNADATINTSGNGKIAFSGGFSIGDYQLTMDGDSSIHIQDAPIVGLGGICKKGKGTLYLKNQNLFSGKTSVYEGNVNVQHSHGFGLNVGGVEIKSGATIELQNGISIQDSLWIQGNLNSEIDVLRNLQGENTWNGTIVLNSKNALIKVSEGSINLSNIVLHNASNLILDGVGVMKCGLISGTGSVTKDGTGDLFFTKTNTNLGSFKLLNGTIELAAPQVIWNGDLELIGGVLNTKGYTIKTNGNWKNSGAEFIAKQNTVIMSGENTSIFGTLKNVFYNLNIMAPVHLAGDVIVKNKLVLGAYLVLEKFDLEIDTSATIEGYKNTSFIVTNDVGKLTRKQIIIDSDLEALIFPVGFSPNKLDFTPCRIVNKGLMSDFSVRIGKERLENGYSGNPKLDYGVDRTWFLSASSKGFIADVTLQWMSAREQTNFSRLNCNVGHFNGVSWDHNADNISAKNQEEYTFSQSRSNLTSFSPFVVENVTALPIRLLYFNAIVESQKVRLEWETASEINNDFFTVERSHDGKMFEQVLTKKGNNESKTNIWYVGFDNNPVNGVVYYRLKQTDFDGKFVYSDIISVYYMHEKFSKLQVFPNPISDNFIQLHYLSELNNLVELVIFTPAGELIYKDNLEVEKGGNAIKNEVSLIPSGIYILKIGNEYIGYETSMFSKQ